MSEPLAVELCQRLKSGGFPQDRFPQCIYVEVQDDLGGGHGLEWGWREEDWARFNWVACPHWGDVLLWLEKEKAIWWAYSTRSAWYAGLPPTATEYQVQAESPEELIEAILERMEKD